MNPQTILLVDDSETHRYALGRHLEQSGYTVLQAHTGAEALKLARSRQIDAILLDINLPDMSGFDVCERLKTDPQTQPVPIIFHSATYDTQSARAQAMDLGAASFLSYPISFEHLLSVLQGVFLNKDRRQRDRS